MKRFKYTDYWYAKTLAFFIFCSLDCNSL